MEIFDSDHNTLYIHRDIPQLILSDFLRKFNMEDLLPSCVEDHNMAVIAANSVGWIQLENGKVYEVTNGWNVIERVPHKNRDLRHRFTIHEKLAYVNMCYSLTIEGNIYHHSSTFSPTNHAFITLSLDNSNKIDTSCIQTIIGHGYHIQLDKDGKLYNVIYKSGKLHQNHIPNPYGHIYTLFWISKHSYGALYKDGGIWGYRILYLKYHDSHNTLGDRFWSINVEIEGRVSLMKSANKIVKKVEDVPE